MNTVEDTMGWLERLWSKLFTPGPITISSVKMDAGRRRSLLRIEAEQNYSLHGWRGQE